MLYDHDGDGIGDFREFAGRNRYETAFRLADNYIRNSDWWHGSRTVLLASGETLVDAMSVAGLAGLLGAPVILTEGDDLNHWARQLIEPKWSWALDRRVQMAHEVIILGGPSAISRHVEQQLRHVLANTRCYDCDLPPGVGPLGRDWVDYLGTDWTPEQAKRASRVVRVHGLDRYSTAAAIARRIRRDARDPSLVSHLARVPGSWCGGNGDAAVLVDGSNGALPYAMLAGPMAARSGLPMLMSDGPRLPPATIDAIRDLDIAHVAIIGGNHVVPPTIEAQLRSSGISTVDRVDGTSPAAVSVELAKLMRGDCADHLWTPGGGVSSDIVALVNAAALPDGVAAAPVLAGPLADGELVPLLLVGGTLPEPVDQHLREMRQSVGYGAGGGIQVAAIGGIASVNRCVVEDALRTSPKSNAAMPTLNERFAAASRGSRLRIADLSVAYTDQTGNTASLKWNYRVHAPGEDTDKSAEALRAWQFRDCYAPTAPTQVRTRYWTADRFRTDMLAHYLEYGDWPWRDVGPPHRAYPGSLIPIDATSFDSETIHQIETRATLGIGGHKTNRAIIFTAIGKYPSIYSDNGIVAYPDRAHPDRPFPHRDFSYLNCSYDACRYRPKSRPMSVPLHPISVPERPGVPPLMSASVKVGTWYKPSLVLHHSIGGRNEIRFSLEFQLEQWHNKWHNDRNNGYGEPGSNLYDRCGSKTSKFEPDQSSDTQRCLKRLRDVFALNEASAQNIPRHLQVQWTRIDTSDDTSDSADWGSAESTVIEIFQDAQDAIMTSFDWLSIDPPWHVGTVLTHSIDVPDPNAKYLVRVRLATDPEGSEPVGDWTKPEWTVPANPHRKLSNKIEKDVVKALGKKHSWLRDAWQHMKAYNAGVKSHWPEGPLYGRGRKDSKSALGTAGSECEDRTYCRGLEIWIGPSCAARASCFKPTAVHELAHIYTLTSTPADRRPATLGAAAMYFVHLTDGHSDCPAHELWADAMEYSVTKSRTWYWRKCPKTPSKPTREALKIVSETIDGTWPSWFRKRYGTSDPDKFNLKKIWSDLDDHYAYEEPTGRISFSPNLSPILAHFSEVFGDPCLGEYESTNLVLGGTSVLLRQLDDEFLETAGHPWGGDKCASSWR